MRGFIQNRYVVLVLRLIIGGVFIYAGALKVKQPQAFADSIASFQLLHHELIALMALSLPLLEILTGVLLVTGLQRRAGALSVMVLTIAFAVALTIALARGIQVDCGCFGSGTPSFGKMWLSLGRDILLMAGACLVYCKAMGDLPNDKHHFT